MCLKEDGISDPDGIIVRPVPGFEGCDYLSRENRLLQEFAFVFGPLIEALKAVGYNQHTMSAVPYDWR